MVMRKPDIQSMFSLAQSHESSYNHVMCEWFLVIFGVVLLKCAEAIQEHRSAKYSIYSCTPLALSLALLSILIRWKYVWFYLFRFLSFVGSFVQTNVHFQMYTILINISYGIDRKRMTNKNNRPTKQVQQTISHSISLQFENSSSAHTQQQQQQRTNEGPKNVNEGKNQFRTTTSKAAAAAATTIMFEPQTNRTQSWQIRAECTCVTRKNQHTYTFSSSTQ